MLKHMHCTGNVITKLHLVLPSNLSNYPIQFCLIRWHPNNPDTMKLASELRHPARGGVATRGTPAPAPPAQLLIELQLLAHRSTASIANKPSALPKIGVGGKYLRPASNNNLLLHFETKYRCSKDWA